MDTQNNITKVVLVSVPQYGPTWLDVSRVIRLVPSRRMVLFESVYWILDKEDFTKVSDIWHQLKG